MSLILDALNRAREDSGSVPGLSTQHAEGAAPSRWLPLLLGGLLVIAVVAIIWLLYNRPEPAVAVVTTKQAEVALTELPSPVEPARAEPQTTPVSAIAAPAVSPVTAESVARAQSERLSDEPPAPEVAALYAQAARGEGDTASASAQRETANPPEASTPVTAAVPTLKQDVRDVDMTRLIEEAESQLENARLEEHSAPFINELSQQSKDRIPTVYYQRHAYSGRAGESRVLLNGKTLKVGDSPVNGMRIEEILPDSVVLRFADIQFRLRALNSWVNL